MRERHVIAELKASGGRVSPAQQEMLVRYAHAGVEVYVWFPEMWNEIIEVLKRREG